MPSLYTLFRTDKQDSLVPLMSYSALSGCLTFLWPVCDHGLKLQPFGAWLVGDIFSRFADQNQPYRDLGSRSRRFSQPLKSQRRPEVQMYGTSSMEERWILRESLVESFIYNYYLLSIIHERGSICWSKLTLSQYKCKSESGKFQLSLLTIYFIFRDGRTKKRKIFRRDRRFGFIIDSDRDEAQRLDRQRDHPRSWFAARLIITTDMKGPGGSSDRREGCFHDDGAPERNRLDAASLSLNCPCKKDSCAIQDAVI